MSEHRHLWSGVGLEAYCIGCFDPAPSSTDRPIDCGKLDKLFEREPMFHEGYGHEIPSDFNDYRDAWMTTALALFNKALTAKLKTLKKDKLRYWINGEDVEYAVPVSDIDRLIEELK